MHIIITIIILSIGITWFWWSRNKQKNRNPTIRTNHAKVTCNSVIDDNAVVSVGRKEGRIFVNILWTEGRMSFDANSRLGEQEIILSESSRKTQAIVKLTCVSAGQLEFQIQQGKNIRKFVVLLLGEYK
jgi:hypothetical protein